MSRVVKMAQWLGERVAPPLPPIGESRRYEAASNAARLSTWVTPSTDATQAINDPIKLRNRSRDLIRNNPWAAKGVQVIVNNAVGYGITPEIKAKAASRQKRLQGLWKAWADTTACDADGINDFYGLQSLVFRAMVESGEVLVRYRQRRADDNLPLPFQIQVLEPDYLADLDNLPVKNGNTVHRGIEFDSLGRRVAYHLYKQHPGSDAFGGFQTETSRVPADEIIHLYRKDRPGQERGVPWLSSVTVTLRELGIYEDAYLKRQQISNLFAGFIYSDNPADLEDELEDEIPDLQPGTLYLMKNGRRIEFSNPPPIGEDPAFRDSCLRRIAAGLGVTYEALTGNLSEVNFSSARMGALEMGRNLDAWLYGLFIPRFCGGVFRWFQEMVAFVDGGPVTSASVEWTPPARAIVDPVKEYSALMQAVRAGLMSLPEAIRSQGYDPDALLAEQADYLAKLDAAGVAVESDYRNEAATQTTPVQP